MNPWYQAVREELMARFYGDVSSFYGSITIGGVECKMALVDATLKSDYDFGLTLQSHWRVLRPH